AELDSAGPAGDAFKKAIDGLTAKGDLKRVDIAKANRDHYWSVAYNDGISKIKDAQNAWPEFSKTPSEDEKPLKEEAAKDYAAAIVALTRAKLLKPGNVVTIRNLGTAYALMGRFDEAEAVLKNGQTEAAGDSSVAGLADALKTVRANKA